MTGCVSIIKSLLSAILVIILFFLILIGIPLSAASQVIIDRENIKSVVLDDELMSSLLDAGIEMVSQNAPQGESGDELYELLSDPDSDVRQEVEAILATDRLKEGIGEIIDAYYDWFEGLTNKPTYSIQIAEDPEEFADLLAIGTKEKLENLPECEIEDVPEVENPLELECLPSDFDIDSIDEIFEENRSDPEFQKLMDKTVISSDSLEISAETTQNVQSLYGILELLPIIFGAVYVALLFLLLALISRVSRSFTIVGIVTLIPSAITLLASIFSETVIQSSQDYASERLPYEAIAFSDAMFTFMKSAGDLFFSKLLLYSIIGISVGAFLIVLGIIFMFIYRRKIAQQSLTIRRPGEDL